MKGCLVILAALLALFLAGLILPTYLVGSGVDDFEGRERRMATRALFHGTAYYDGPPLVLGWHVEGVEECPPLPRGEEPREDGYRAWTGGRSARIGAYTLFGIPRGEVEVTCGGRREWESYF